MVERTESVQARAQAYYAELAEQCDAGSTHVLDGYQYRLLDPAVRLSVHALHGPTGVETITKLSNALRTIGQCMTANTVHPSKVESNNGRVLSSSISKMVQSTLIAGATRRSSGTLRDIRLQVVSPADLVPKVLERATPQGLGKTVDDRVAFVTSADFFAGAFNKGRLAVLTTLQTEAAGLYRVSSTPFLSADLESRDGSPIQEAVWEPVETVLPFEALGLEIPGIDTRR